jgi:8-oxo-dGTP pyrophosphatase MutT (NUDIX family)
MPKIKILKDEVVYDGRYIKTVRRHFLNTSGKKKYWEMVQRKIFGKIVAIVPITPKKEIILTKIYRIPIKKYVIELCAGLTDKKGEKELETIKRELLEETGYKAEKIKKIITGPYNSGLSETEMTIYLGINAKRIQKPVLEDSEDIEIIKIPLSKIHSYLQNPPKGVLVDIKIFSILFLLERMGYKF